MKYLLSLTFLLIAIIAFGQRKAIELTPKPAPEIPLILMDSVFLIADEIPALAMFNHIEDYEIRKDSSIREMLNIIYKNIKYPPICRDNCFEGTAVVSFIIEKDGTMTNAKIIRNPGCNTGEEALRVIQLLPKFSPAIKDGKAVRFLFNFPVRFSLM